MEKTSANHAAWRMRIVIGSIILLCSFIGLVIGNLWNGGSLFYWRWMAPIFALLCLWLNWFLRRKNHSLSLTTIWHELFHWVGVLMTIYLVSLFTRSGLIGNIVESLVVMAILALSIFLIGIYTEWSLIPVGIILGVFTAGAAFAEAYLYTIMLPFFFVGLCIFGLVVHFLHQNPAD